jgi:hypothetical protein
MPNNRKATDQLDAYDRWALALHESAHAIIGRVLFGGHATAAICHDGRGISTMIGTSPNPSPVAVAVHAAAGKAGQDLESTWGPPADPGRPPAGSTPAPFRFAETPEEAALTHSLPSDRQTVDACFHESRLPDALLSHWRGFVAAAARELVKTHETAIVKLAIRLYCTGRATTGPEQATPAPFASAAYTPPATPAPPPAEPAEETTDGTP